MTCQECQPLAIDLARGLPPFDVGGAVQRADGLSHIATCKRCAQWLREQEALSDALRAAAEADASLAAPPRVEANVMAAWRSRQSQPKVQPHESLARPELVTHAARPEQLANAACATHRVAASTADQSVARPHAAEAHAAGAHAAGAYVADVHVGGAHAAQSDQVEARKLGALVIDRARTRRRAIAWAWRPAWPAGRAAGFAAAATIVIVALTLGAVRWLNPSPAVNDGTKKAGGSSTSSPPIAEGSGGRGGESAGAPVSGTNAAVIEVLPDKGKKGRPTPPRSTAPQSATARGLDAAETIGTAPGALRESPSTGPPTRMGFDDRAGAGGRGARATTVTRAAAATRRGATMRVASVASETSGASGASGAREFSGPTFVLLPYVEPLRPTEMRHIMRVRMPRAQLAAGGLQADGVDDAAVLADVLVGEDGTARAVRIVQ